MNPGFIFGANRPVKRSARTAIPFLLALLLLLTLFGTALAARPLPALTGRVVDSADMVSRSQEEQLNNLLAAYEQETGNQVVVATIPSLDGDSIEAYSIRLAEAWKIGQRGSDNGVILLVSRDDREVRIEVGYGLESALNDARCGDIIRQEIVPAFQQGNYDSGISRAVAAIIGYVSPDFRFEGFNPPPVRTESGEGFGGFAALVVILVIMSIFGSITGGRSARRYRRGFSSSLLNALLWSLLFNDGRHHSSRDRDRFGGGGFGGGGFGGGGFSGGGGGFGGGGASGKW